MNIKSALSTSILIATCCLSSATTPQTLDYATLNNQALEEYNEPIRPGDEQGNDFWNGFAEKFIYAPAFKFNEIDGASKYVFTITPDSSASHISHFESLSFTASKPTASLKPIWSKIPVGYVILRVNALDSKNTPIGKMQERRFLRDFGFNGPYLEQIRPHAESAIRGLLYIHNMPQVQSWLSSTEPDLSYANYSYANKIISAVIRNEVLVAKHVPSERDKALTIANTAAAFLIRESQNSEAPLAGFPPTYYGNLIACSMNENQGSSMTMDANYAVHAFLDLYDATGNKRYYNQAYTITQTYTKLQRADGSFPIKVSTADASPLTQTPAMLHAICFTADRFKRQYGVTEFNDMLKRAEEWMHNVAIPRFDMNAQFEDVSVLGLQPYENLSNYVAANYARYLLKKENPTTLDIYDAEQLIKLSEDQFTHWNYLPDTDGLKKFNTPCVVEQYKFREPIDNSAANVSGAFLEHYRVTGSKLSYAKAKALIDNMTIQQNQQSGFMPTYWRYERGPVNELDMWANCALTTIERLFDFASETLR